MFNSTEIDVPTASVPQDGFAIVMLEEPQALLKTPITAGPCALAFWGRKLEGPRTRPANRTVIMTKEMRECFIAAAESYHQPSAYINIFPHSDGVLLSG